MLMMTIFDPTRGSYSLGGVLLRRNTLYSQWTLRFCHFWRQHSPSRGSIMSAMIYKVLRCLTPTSARCGFFLPERLFSDRNHHCWRQTLPWRKNVDPVKLSANGSHVTPFLLGVKRLRCTAVLFQPSFQPCEIHDTTFLHNMTCDVYARKNLTSLLCCQGRTCSKNF